MVLSATVVALVCSSVAPQTPPPARPAPTVEVAPADAHELERFDSSTLAVPMHPDDASMLQPLPGLDEIGELLDLELTPERVDLGRMLFHDTRLSGDHTVSCATCHDLRFGGVDRHVRAVGIHGQVGPVNTPTVFNAALQIAQFWDGRAADLQEQAGGPPEASGEMGSTFAEILARLRLDGGYERAFRAAFPGRVERAGDIDRDLVLEAIATFEVTLITPDAPFDRWVEGDADALGPAARRGYALFEAIGCSECHYGEAIGGKAYQKLGRKLAYFTGAHIAKADLGRMNVTGDERDRHTFKVPTLRNIAATAPYFHDGSVATLHEAVELMAHHQLGYELERRDVDDVVAFLRSLTGTYEGRPLLPELPAEHVSGARGAQEGPR